MMGADVVTEIEIMDWTLEYQLDPATYLTNQMIEVPAGVLDQLVAPRPGPDARDPHEPESSQQVDRPVHGGQVGSGTVGHGWKRPMDLLHGGRRGRHGEHSEHSGSRPRPGVASRSQDVPHP